MENLFERFLKTTRQGYGQVDKNIFKGLLPGGASISSGIAPLVRMASQSPVYKTLRDKVAIPVLDKGMEAGLVPAKEGMFARFLSGTAQPLERIPAETKAAEALLNQKLTQAVTVQPLRIAAEKSLEDWRKASTNVSNQNEMYYTHGIGAPETQEQTKRVNMLDQKVNDYVKQLGLRDRFELIINPSKEQQIKERQTGYTPLNYTVDNYKRMGALGLDLNEDQTNLVTKGLVNTLGQYKVQDGRTVKERYDFNSYNAGTPLYLPGSMVGAVIGEPMESTKLADKALALADKLGFIQPGAGYPVEFKFR